MTTDRNQKILGLIERLSIDVKLAQEHSLDLTARLLAMALLDLQTELYSIPPHELRSFTRAVANVVDSKIGTLHGDVGSRRIVQKPPKKSRRLGY
jgi:hypothetical protein